MGIGSWELGIRNLLIKVLLSLIIIPKFKNTNYYFPTPSSQLPIPNS
jgi:hypothetical protein